MGKKRSFVFDKVFDDTSTQNEVYEACAKEIALGCFDGYNATILAYG
jgi:kinesin family protein 18/19